MIWKMNLYLLFYIFSLELTTIICASKCEDFADCTTCIFSTVDDCIWCSEENYKGKRCQPRNTTDTCNKNEINNREKEIVTRPNDDDFSSVKDNIVQLKPQKASIKLISPGVPVDIKMYYKPAKDAPLDIYFLLDNSKNLQSYRKSLIHQTKSIFEGIKNYTNNVHLGVGTFIEKPVLPYADPDYDNVYAFKNDQALTKDSDLFVKTLTNIKHGGNYDPPENLLDGLMQAMICKEQIKWRNNSQRVIVAFTNEFYHSAGDGKIVGAFKRHNMECYTNDDMYKIMDYPSISQINKVAKDNGYIIIFAYIKDKTTNNPVNDYYRLLSEKIYGAKYAKLSHENIAQIIKEEYVKIIEDVKMDYETEIPSDVQVTITKTCPDCKAMHSNALEFVVTVTLISSKPVKDKEIIKIKPMSMNEALELEIEFQYKCKCEKEKKTNSTKCNSEGTYQCGICKCNRDRFGDYCACKGDSTGSNDDYEKCRKNPSDAFSCSGHGECTCGKCESCHKGFSGPFCEYDENACPRPGGKLCSGHGSCVMGVCQCDRNWVHSLNGIDDCGCTLEQNSCIAPYSHKVCSGNGECKCGRCVCTGSENSNDTCTGRYCDKCSWFTAKRCQELEDYAYCRFLNETSCQDSYNMTDIPKVVFANRSEINSPNNSAWYMANLCRVKKGHDESILVFKYYYTSEADTGSGTTYDTLLNLVIQNELDKKPPADIWVPIGSAIGGILLIGLLSLLLWKCLADYYDEKEYNQFAERAKAAGYNVDMTENPHYEPPTTTFINPVHDANIVRRRQIVMQDDALSC